MDRRSPDPLYINGLTYYSPIVILTSAAQARISVYPNPASNQVVLQVTVNRLLNTTAKLYDAEGRLVTEFRINSSKQYIDLQRFANGTLTLRLKNGKTFTIIKEKRWPTEHIKLNAQIVGLLLKNVVTHLIIH